MTPLRPPLRPVSLANRYFGYIVTVILTGYAKADLGKEITRSCKASTTLTAYEPIELDLYQVVFQGKLLTVWRRI